MTSNKPSFVAANWTKVGIVPKINNVCLLALQSTHPPPPPSMCMLSDTLSHSVAVSVCPFCLPLVWFTSSIDTIETAVFWLWPWPWRSQTDLFAWHSTLYYALTFQFCLQKCPPFRRYYLDKHSLKFALFAVTLILDTAIQSFCKTIQLMIVYHKN